MKQKYNQQVIAIIKEWITDNLEQRLSIDDIAQKSGYSKWYLQKLFARYYSETLARYIRRKKLTHCIADLHYSDTPIIRLALKYHFESQQSLTRSFKQTLGCTPLQCRRRRLSHEAEAHIRNSDDPCAIWRRMEGKPGSPDEDPL